MSVLAISGSPKPNGNVDRLVKLITQNLSQKVIEYIYLRDLQINPCSGCLACVKTNSCVQKDDWNSIDGKISQAEMMVLGVPVYFGGAFGINALTHTFLERWFSLRHRGFSEMKLKKVILAAVAGEKSHADIAINNLTTFFEVYHGIEVVDSITVEGTIPCYVCGLGEECPISFFIARYGKEAKLTSDLIVPMEKRQIVYSKSKKELRT